MNRLKSIAAMAAVTLILTAVPALAAEGEEDTIGGNSPLVLLLATEFGMTEQEVLDLAALGFGFGEIFKLKLFSLVFNVTIADLLGEGDTETQDDGEDTGEDGEEIDTEDEEEADGFGWGALKKTLTEEQLATLDALPRNFGQIVSDGQRGHGRDEHQPDGVGGGKPGTEDEDETGDGDTGETTEP